MRGQDHVEPLDVVQALLLQAARILFIDLRPIEKADVATLDDCLRADQLRFAPLPNSRLLCNGAIRKSFRRRRGDAGDACRCTGGVARNLRPKERFLERACK